MKKLTHTLFGITFTLALLLNSGNVYAQKNTEELRNNISELRKIHNNMKIQVSSEGLSLEEASTQWLVLVVEARAEKEAFFKAKMAQIEVKYQEVLKGSPERAALLRGYIDTAKDRRDTVLKKSVELKQKIESGAITRKEAQHQKVEFAKTQQANFQEIKNGLKEKRKETQIKRSGLWLLRQRA
jgi:hypothetical protein